MVFETSRPTTSSSDPVTMISSVGASAIHLASNDQQRLVLLVAHLEKIRTAARPQDVESAMRSFTSEVLLFKNQQDRPDFPLMYPQANHRQTVSSTPQRVPEVMAFSQRDDEGLIFNLEYHGAAIATILNAMDRFSDRGVTADFYNNAIIALVQLAFQSKGRSQSIYEQGGMKAIIRIMEHYRSIDFIQTSGIAAMMVLGINILASSRNGILDAETMSLEAQILFQIVEAMEHHQSSSRVYIVACSALGTLFGPGSRVLVDGGDLENYIYHRVLYALTYGLILHNDEPVAHGVGHALLSNMVGPDVAEEMIAEVDSNHCDITCAAAA